MLLILPLELPEVLAQCGVLLLAFIPEAVSMAIEPELEGVAGLPQVLFGPLPAGHLRPVHQGLGLALSLKMTSLDTSSSVAVFLGWMSWLVSLEDLLVVPRID